MRKMLLMPLIVSMVALLFVLPIPVKSTQPTEANGTFDYTFEILNMRFAGPNTFLYAVEHDTWTGTFTGTSESFFRVGIFSKAGFWNVWLEGTFTGWVLDKYGTMTFNLVGKKPDGGEWYGQWVILSGTGDLKDLHGQGNWWGPGFGAPGPDIYYSGNIHFELS
jgi:hypothetical protein